MWADDAEWEVNRERLLLDEKPIFFCWCSINWQRIQHKPKENVRECNSLSRCVCVRLCMCDRVFQIYYVPCTHTNTVHEKFSLSVTVTCTVHAKIFLLKRIHWQTVSDLLNIRTHLQSIALGWKFIMNVSKWNISYVRNCQALSIFYISWIRSTVFTWLFWFNQKKFSYSIDTHFSLNQIISQLFASIFTQ